MSDAEDNILNLGMEKAFPKEAELTNRLVETCYEYDELGSSAVMGSLLAAAMVIWADQFLDPYEVEDEE